MSQKVIIPTLLRRFTNDKEEVEVQATTIKDLIATLDKNYPGFQARVCEETGELRRFINIYVNGEDIRFLDDLATRTTDGAEISIVPAIAGG